MSALTRWMVLRGQDRPPPRQVPLRAGPLSLLFEDGDLKRIRLAGREVVRRVYSAVRDRNWGTTLPRISELEIDDRGDSFRVSYLAEHVKGEIDFAWRASIDGGRDGSLRFRLDGEARSTFLRSRIGFCILHPPGCVGGPCVCEHANGEVERGKWPLLISPRAPFTEIRALSHEPFPGVWVHVRFDGDIFEMEDHRNWTDASYKTFCTPLRLPYPVEISKGTRVTQEVSMRIEGAPPAAAGALRAAPGVSVGSRDAPLGLLPRIGLCAASHGEPLAAREVERLRALRLSHLRAELHLSSDGWDAELRRAWKDASAIGARLEAAVFVTDDAPRELEALGRALREVSPRVGAWLVFHESERVTSSRSVRLARGALEPWDPTAVFGSGTNVEFVDVNRERPPLGLIDLACYSVSPQVHAFDDDSLMETLEAQAATVESARAWLGGLPIAVTPVTLRRRFNPDATGPEPEPGPGELPAHVDPRQLSLLGAAWTAGSLTRLAGAGAASVTYFETTGWLGVMEPENVAWRTEPFSSVQGATFPLYHVLADAGEMRGGELIACSSSDSLRVEALAVRGGGRLRVLVASLRPEAQEVSIEGLGERVAVRALDETTAEEAMMRPEAFRARPGEDVRAPGGKLGLALRPYAVVRIDMPA